MVGYNDASFSATPDHHKSTTAYLFFPGTGLSSFGAKTQSLTAQPTAETELQALRYGAMGAMYLCNFLTEIGFGTFNSMRMNLRQVRLNPSTDQRFQLRGQ